MELLPPAQGSLSGGWPALPERESHPLEYTTLPGRTKQQLGCRRISVSLIYSDGFYTDRQVTSGKTFIFHDQELEQLAITALFRCWRRRILVRTIGLHCSLVAHPVRQLSLLEHVNKKQQKQNELSRAVDMLHERFGATALTRGGGH